MPKTVDFTITSGMLASGLRPVVESIRNSNRLVTCHGAVGRDGVLSVLDAINRLDTSSLVVEFPFPQIFAFDNHTIVCSSTKIYEYIGVNLINKLTVSSVNGAMWTAVSSYDYIYLSNGKDVVVRNPSTGEYSIDTTGLPFSRAACNFNGQVICAASVAQGNGTVGYFSAVASVASISGVWSDEFTGEDESSIDSTKWSSSDYGESKISYNQLNIWPEPHYLYDFLGYIYSNAPMNTRDLFTAFIKVDVSIVLASGGGYGIGWWNESKAWGIIHGFHGAGWQFFTPSGIFNSPESFTGYSLIELKLVKNGANGSAYYRKTPTASWTLISSASGLSSQPICIGVAGGDTPKWYRLDDFKISFSTTGDPFVDLLWNLVADSYSLLKDGLEIYSGTETAYTDLNVLPDNSYTYIINGYDSSGILIETLTTTVFLS